MGAITITALLILAQLFIAAQGAEQENVIVCYYGSWAIYRPNLGKFTPEDTDPSLCTHLVYGFVGLTRDGDVRIIDPWMDLPDGLDGFNRFLSLKSKNPRIKVLLGLGGWNEGSETFSYVANNPYLRTDFAYNAAAFVQRYGFDGLDLDWEYPGRRGGVASDKEAFVELARELSQQLKRRNLMLTAAVGSAISVIDTAYDVPQIQKYFDFVSVMAYDFHGSWDRSTGFSAPLYPEPNVSEKNRYLNVNASIHAWLSRGADPRKLVLGIPLYSRTFTLENPAENGVGAPARGPGRKGPYTREAGTLGFNEICELQSGGQYAENWDDNQKVPFAAQGDQWIGYDNQRSAGLKVQLARDLGLAGVMVWSLETDDFRAKCSSVTGSGAFPMLKAIRQALESGTPPPPSPTTPSPELPCVSATSTPFSTSTTNAAVCTRIGNVRDPDDCAVFYKCAHIGQPLYQYKFTCQTGLYFDEALQLCNWKNQVKCP